MTDFRQEIERLLEGFLSERPDLFLVDLKISPADDVVVILDGDEGVSIQDCLDASRAIEFSMDRDAHDFSLQVMSAGLSEPLSMPRQYVKNIGRSIKVQALDGKEQEGELISADDEKCTLQWKYRKPKEVGKGKVDVVETQDFPYSEIRKAWVVVKF